MSIWSVRLFFIFLSIFTGHYLSSLIFPGNSRAALAGAFLGLAGIVALIVLERSVRRVSTRDLSAAVFGLFFGLIMTWVLLKCIKLIPMPATAYLSMQLVLMIILCYLGVVVAIQGKDEFSVIIPYVQFKRQDMREETIILDTSVIIDGRIADIGKTGFLEGRFIVPRFVLKELHQIADSADPLRRNRGRRGLDMLNKIKNNSASGIKIEDEDFAEIKDVDAKIVKLAKLMNAKILTNDYNLNKVAQLEGVHILNVNELANALKTVVLPGEIMQVKIVKEGKEKSQGIGYLEDGTMVVVDHARHLIGKAANVTITSALQTSAGRMIFARLDGGEATG